MEAKKKKTPVPIGVKFTSIDEYHVALPGEIRDALERVRMTIRKAVPKAEEAISYNIPAFRLHGVFIYYAAFKKHISVFPAPSGGDWDRIFEPFKTSGKGTIQFPLDQPLPVSLIRKIAIFLANEDVKKHSTIKKASKIRLDEGIKTYNNTQSEEDRKICRALSREICRVLPEAENKIWHAHPVWFLDGNPIVGYSKLKNCVRLLFWSGQSFNEPSLANEGYFKAAEIRYTSAGQINKNDLVRWLQKSMEIQWDYKNIVRRKGVLERLR